MYTYTLLSLGLGLLAWFLGALAVWKRCSIGCVVGSFTACGGALVAQFYEIQWRVEINDYAAICDTIRATCLAAVVLLAVTVGLNLAAVLRRKMRS